MGGADISMAISLSRWQPRDDLYRYPQLFAGSCLLSGIGLFLSHAWNLPEKGLVSVFLAAAALTTWFRYLLAENRDAIWLARQRPRDVNLRTAGSVLAMFMGVVAAFAVAAALLGEDQTRGGFGFIFASAAVGDGTILDRQFADFDGVLRHNLQVLVAFFCLAFVYHAYGALLTIAWNACAWSLVLVVLVARGAAVTDVSPALFVTVATAAVLPHLVLEAAGYVSATLASVFISRAVFKYGVSDPRTRQVLVAGGKLLATATVMLIVAAWVESTLPRWALAQLAN